MFAALYILGKRGKPIKKTIKISLMHRGVVRDLGIFTTLKEAQDDWLLCIDSEIKVRQFMEDVRKESRPVFNLGDQE